MRIIVKESGEKAINIVIPNWLLLNRLTALIGSAVIDKQKGDAGIKIGTVHLCKLFRALRRVKRRHGRLELVTVESSGGDKVQIIL